MQRVVTILFVIMVAGGSGCSKAERWDGFIYPDRHNLLIRRSSGSFKSLEVCQGTSMAMLESLEAVDKGYYECGKNCDSTSSYYGMTCEEMVRGNLYK